MTGDLDLLLHRYDDGTLPHRQSLGALATFALPVPSPHAAPSIAMPTSSNASSESPASRRPSEHAGIQRKCISPLPLEYGSKPPARPKARCRSRGSHGWPRATRGALSDFLAAALGH